MNVISEKIIEDILAADKVMEREETQQGWLGEKDSNPHSQSQNLMSYP